MPKIDTPATPHGDEVVAKNAPGEHYRKGVTLLEVTDLIGDDILNTVGEDRSSKDELSVLNIS